MWAHAAEVCYLRISPTNSTGLTLQTFFSLGKTKCMMKSSDCVIKHAGVYSTGLAMVVSCLLLSGKSLPVLRKGHLTSDEFPFTLSALSPIQSGVVWILWDICLIFFHVHLIFDCLLLTEKGAKNEHF